MAMPTLLYGEMLFLSRVGATLIKIKLLQKSFYWLCRSLVL